MSDTLASGDKAPAFKLKDQNDELINMADYLGRQPLVIYFYPKDDTPGCTKEACAFRDSHKDFTDLNVKVFGISSDSVAAHQKFADKYHLPFTLLSDEDNYVRNELFGVPRDLLGILPGRVTYIIDQAGKIAYVYKALSGAKHHLEALDILKGLS